MWATILYVGSVAIGSMVLEIEEISNVKNVQKVMQTDRLMKLQNCVQKANLSISYI